ncbi:hypothetical protein CK203_006161 [Vitis vinifera]|uniref:Uncharacterized protein n=1 Tax=Vitis vinifera TaxID=29760 RepID=A0A438K611_VITVI|nr:hypothetical protein CK203_006161 [Vitis vinifera]
MIIFFYVQEFYNGDLLNCERTHDKMGRTAQVSDGILFFHKKYCRNWESQRGKYYMRKLFKWTMYRFVISSFFSFMELVMIKKVDSLKVNLDAYAMLLMSQLAGDRCSFLSFDQPLTGKGGAFDGSTKVLDEREHQLNRFPTSLTSSGWPWPVGPKPT